MPCSNCGSTNSISYIAVSTPCPDCSCTPVPTSCNPCTGEQELDASKVVYSGSALLCSDVAAGDKVEEILQKLDEKICEVSGTAFAGTDVACLTNSDETNITTQKEFNEAAAGYMCNLQTVHNTFVTEYNTFVTNITEQIDGVSVAGITSCDGVGIDPADTVPEALTKISDAICSLQTDVNISAVSWNVYGFTVGSIPSTIAQMATKLLDYIGQTKNLIPSSTTSLPVFNNVGSCLPGTLTTTDTLSATVGKIKTKLCSLSYDFTTLDFGCVTTATTLEDVVQNIMDRLNQHSIYTFDTDQFTVTDDISGPCAAKAVALTLETSDSKVASNGSDLTPGYLSDKLLAGAGMAFDYTTTPGKVICTATTTGDHKIKVNSSDSVADYLDVKIDGVADTTGSLTLAATANGGNTKVVITPTIDFETFAAQLLTAIQGDLTLSDQLAAMVCGYNCTTGPTVRVTIKAGLSDKSVQAVVTQLAPTLAWYNSGATVVTSGGSIAGGPFAITTTAVNPQCTINLDNNGVTSYTFSIYVKDVYGNPVTGSSSVGSTSLVAGSPYINSAFNLGTGTTDYVIHIDFV